MKNIFFTGATGGLGSAILAQLLADDPDSRITSLLRGPAVQERAAQLSASMPRAWQNRLRFIAGDITLPELGVDAASLADLQASSNIIVHAAADTRFRVPQADQAKTNVDGTQHVLDLARRCPRLNHWVLASTTCVAGEAEGRILEIATKNPPAFVNGYEQTKWQAEQTALGGGVPVRIVRLSTVIGDVNGRVSKPNAFHHALRWIHRGLIPMIPGAAETAVDFISIEKAARAMAFAVKLPVVDNDIWHIAAGDGAARLEELMESAVGAFKQHTTAWRSGQITPPMIVDSATFDLFRATIDKSGDFLFRQVIEAVNSFLPGLRHPKIYDTHKADAAIPQLSGGQQNWRELARRVIDRQLATDWGKADLRETDHA